MNDDVPYLLVPDCGYAILFDEDASRDFEDALAEADAEAIKRVFVVTDSDEAYAEMRSRLPTNVQATMLYRDVLRHFRRRTSS